MHGQMHGRMDTVGHVGILLFVYLLLFFGPSSSLAGIFLSSLNRIEPVPPVVNVQGPDHWTERIPPTWAF